MSVTGKGQVSQRTSFMVLISIVAILLSAMALFRPGMVLGFTAGDNGHPTSGPYSDLNGGSATFTFQNNAQLFCDANDGASSVSAAARPDPSVPANVGKPDDVRVCNASSCEGEGYAVTVTFTSKRSSIVAVYAPGFSAAPPAAPVSVA